MRKWCFPGNKFYMRNADECSGVSDKESSLCKIIHKPHELMMMMISEKECFRI